MNPEKYLGQSVTVVLREGTYHGVISRLDSVSRRITLRDVHDPATGKKYPGFRHFYVVEILDLKFDVNNEYSTGELTYEDTHSLSCDEDEPNDIDTDEENEIVEITQAKRNDSDVQLATSCDRYTIIDRKSLKPILDYIRRKRSIGLNIESLGEGRFGTIIWITIAVKSHVYIFDFKILEKNIFNYGLKAILEDSTITKFIHDCRFMSDLLYHNYNVQLTNVFDTQVADVFVHRIWHGYGQQDTWPKYVQNLAACLYGHLELSTEQISCIRIRQNRSKQEEDFWTQQPLSVPLAERLYSSVVYIEELGHLLMNKMMVEYLACVDIYLGTTRDLNDSEALWTLNKREFLPKSFSDINKFTHVIKESFKDKENKPIEFCFRQSKSCTCESPIPNLGSLQSREECINTVEDPLQCDKDSKVSSHHHKVCKNDKKPSTDKKSPNSKDCSTHKNFLNGQEFLKRSEDFSSMKERLYQNDSKSVEEQSPDKENFTNIKGMPEHKSSTYSEVCHTCFKDFSENKEQSSYHKKYKDCQKTSTQLKNLTDISFSSTVSDDHKEIRSSHLKHCFNGKESHYENCKNTPDPSLCSKRHTKNSKEHPNSFLDNFSSKNTSAKNMDFSDHSEESQEENVLIEDAQKIFQNDFTTPGLRNFLDQSSGPSSKLNCWWTEKESNVSKKDNSKVTSYNDHQKTEKVHNKVDVDSSAIDWSLYKGVPFYNNVIFYPAGYQRSTKKKNKRATDKKLKCLHIK